MTPSLYRATVSKRMEIFTWGFLQKLGGTRLTLKLFLEIPDPMSTCKIFLAVSDISSTRENSLKSILGTTAVGYHPFTDVPHIINYISCNYEIYVFFIMHLAMPGKPFECNVAIIMQNQVLRSMHLVCAANEEL